MEIREITDEELKAFVLWFRNHFGKIETFAAGMSVSMAGHFHITTKQAMRLLERCKSIGLIKMKKENITILVSEEE